MWKCPVCNEENGANTLCCGCGFDNSANVLCYPTLMQVKLSMERFLSAQRKRWGKAFEKAFQCPECGGITFHVLPEEQALVCAFCGGAMLLGAQEKQHKSVLQHTFYNGILVENGRIRIGHKGKVLSEEEAALCAKAFLLFTQPERTYVIRKSRRLQGDLFMVPTLPKRIYSLFQHAKELSFSKNHISILRNDGTVSVINHLIGVRDLQNWHDICTISSTLTDTYGIDSKGQLYGIGFESDNMDWIKKIHLHDIVSISCGGQFLTCLHSNGTVSQIKSGKILDMYGIDDWSEVTSISAGDRHLLGLRKDGTVLAAGCNDGGQCAVSSWRNVAVIAAGHNYSAAITEMEIYAVQDEH